jgi:hypothetical protein
LLQQNDVLQAEVEVQKEALQAYMIESAAEVKRLWAAIESVAAMVRKTNPDLANALLRRLGRRPASDVW